jgi:hypothetical protein
MVLQIISHFLYLIQMKKLYILFSFFAMGACKKFVAVNAPATNITEANVYKDDATAAAVLTGIYTRMSVSSGGSASSANGLTSMSYYPGLSADELTLYAGTGTTSLTLLAYYQNALKTNNTGVSDFWVAIYPIIYIANAAVQQLPNATLLTPAVRQQLLGEAYFIRAFCYFYLVNLYGDVPLVLGTDYVENASLPRTLKEYVYQQIVIDLKSAQALLNVNFVDASVLKTTTERIRPNKAAATALLARVYLYTNDFSNAEIQATNVINNKSLYDTVSLNDVFKKNSKETIWALQPVLGTTSQNTGDGKIFILPATGPSVATNPVYLSNNLMNNFESGDLRKTNWTKVVPNTTYNYAYKYKIGAVNTTTQEYTVMLRLSEVYLIRAEARMLQGKLTGTEGSIADLNIIRARAGLPAITTSVNLVTAIAHERQVELFTEWGHRWLDLKRTGEINTVMKVVTPQKGGSWDSRWALYPIPLSEIDKDPALKQNPGYENP